jgi:hypothetical protein
MELKIARLATASVPVEVSTKALWNTCAALTASVPVEVSTKALLKVLPATNLFSVPVATSLESL